MPETPPPRRAPAPHTNTPGWAVSVPQRPTSLGVFGEGPLQVAVEDVAPGHAERRLDLQRRPSPRRTPATAGSRRSARPARCRATRARRRTLWRSAPTGSWRNSRAGWCSPNSVNVCAPAAARSSPRMLGSVSEWQYTSHGVTSGMRPAAASAWATFELAVALVDVEGAGERVPRVPPSDRAGPAVGCEQHVDLELGALGGRRAGSGRAGGRAPPGPRWRALATGPAPSPPS